MHETTPTNSPPAEGSGAMFDRIAHRYDVLNRLLSGGADRRWRRRAVRALAPEGGGPFLDLATGTGDLALEILARAPRARVVGIDPSENMLARARDKSRRARVASRLDLQIGDAERIPAADDAFAGAAIAFGIRNVGDRSRALAELCRVVRPGGRVVILELSEPRDGALRPLTTWYIHRALPRIGAALSGAREYRYLERSIAAFPDPESFAHMMAEVGLTSREISPLCFGVCHLFVASAAEAA